MNVVDYHWLKNCSLVRNLGHFKNEQLDPSVLFLDEPTTGLDSTSARIVVSTLRAIARSGRTVVCTVHQPSYVVMMTSSHDRYTLLEMFDVIMIVAGGRTVFYGNVIECT